MELRVAGTISESIVDGPGFRYVVFTQGCPHHCPGCQNPQTHPFEGGELRDTDELLEEILRDPLLSGVTFSGGEPFCQPKPLADLAKKAHEKGKNIFCYTGYTYEQLMENPEPAVHELLDQVDILVDGRFEQDQRDLLLRFRGSRNQRLIDVRQTRAQGAIVLWESKY
ncbi:MAG: anaerobic ribonucleoside-triphosphate reductase activating protein [Butyricicoccaceae bacterium]